jgi:hypothetical protein
VGLVAAAFVAVVGLRWVPDLLAAAALLSTWGLLGLAAVGAVCGRGRRRAAWLGAALFGIGYMALICDHDPDPPNWPHLATDRLLNSLRPWLPHYVRVFPTLSDAANACVLKALEQPVSLHYPDETPLEDVLKAIRDAVRCPDGHGIPIYVDPIGLLEAERTMQVPVSIDVGGVPLRTCLRLLMRQIEMDYRVEDGVLYIDSRGGEYTPLEASEDPFLVVGHCLLALVAAGIGGLLAPLVSDPRCEPTGRAESASADV